MEVKFTPADHAEIERMAKRLVRRYARISDDVRCQGRAWYPAAHYTAGSIDRARPERAAAVLAALSPRNVWSQNVDAARRFIAWADDDTLGMDDMPRVHTRCQTLKARACTLSSRADAILTGPKENAFYANICGDADRVTVDGWATLAACGRGFSPARGKPYARFERAYQLAARRCGETPRDFQAIIWIDVRGRHD